jgi:hypothetical protein
VKGEVMRRMVEGHRGDHLDLTDGLKVGVGGGWVLVLPDPDRPSYRVIASQENEEDAVRELELFSRAVSETVDRCTSSAPEVPARPGNEDVGWAGDAAYEGSSRP